MMMIGAGQAGQIILRDIERAKEPKAKVCCMIDDNPEQMGTLYGECAHCRRS